MRTPATKPKGFTRRNFLSYAIAALLGGALSFLLGVPLIGSFLSPLLARKTTAAGWTELGETKDFPTGEPVVAQWVATAMDGWVSEPVSRAAWVYTPDGENFVVWNPRCTHLGCAYGWKTSGPHQGHFFCPCHDGVWEITGMDTRVIGGPPPRPLDTLPTKIEGGKLYAQHRDFRKGISGKIEV